MKNYVLYDTILDVNKTLPLVKSTKELLKFLNIEISSLEAVPRDTGCESIGLDIDTFYDNNAKTLALASEKKSSIVCVEDSSFLSLKLTLEQINSDKKLQARLDSENINIDLDMQIYTLADFILKEVGVKKIKEKVKNSFDNFQAALYLGSYQCQLSNLSDISSYAKIAQSIGLKFIDYSLKNQVDGYEINDVVQDLSYKMAGGLMLDMFDNAADFVLINDARSFIMFDEHQKKLEKSTGREIGLAVFNVAQLLLLAFGVADKDKIGLSEHKVNSDIA